MYKNDRIDLTAGECAETLRIHLYSQTGPVECSLPHAKRHKNHKECYLSSAEVQRTFDSMMLEVELDRM